MAAALQPGGIMVLHEYFDYATWRGSPRCLEIEEFVSAVMRSWRETGGEPDIALQLPPWLEQFGLELKQVRPIVNVVGKENMFWDWLRTFIQVGRKRLVDLGYLESSGSEKIWRAFTAFEAAERNRMVTPAMLELIARRAA